MLGELYGRHVGEFDGNAGDRLLVQQLDGGTVQWHHREYLRVRGGNTAATSATALFTKSNFLLTVNRAGIAGGTVIGLGGGISCGPAAGVANCAIDTAFGTAVTLTETPPSGGTFSGWAGTPTACMVSAATCTFNMPAGPETVTATFVHPLRRHRLTISKSHVGGLFCGR